MIHLLDTDHMSLLERGGPAGTAIRLRLRHIALDDVGTTIISYEEQMRGWLSQIAQAAKAESQIRAYQRLKRELRNYCDIAVIDNDANAIAEFERLKQAKSVSGQWI